LLSHLCIGKSITSAQEKIINFYGENYGIITILILMQHNVVLKMAISFITTISKKTSLRNKKMNIEQRVKDVISTQLNLANNQLRINIIGSGIRRGFT